MVSYDVGVSRAGATRFDLVSLNLINRHRFVSIVNRSIRIGRRRTVKW